MTWNENAKCQWFNQTSAYFLWYDLEVMCSHIKLKIKSDEIECRYDIVSWIIRKYVLLWVYSDAIAIFLINH